MTAVLSGPTGAPPPPRARLCLGVTGHREDNAAFTAQRAGIESVLARILNLITAAVAAEPPASGAGLVAPTRLHCLLADGTDQLAANAALARGWELVAPLPFGLALNVAINAHPVSAADARALLADPADAHACSVATRDRAARIHALADRALLFQLADRDAVMRELLLAKLQDPASTSARHLPSLPSPHCG